MSRPTILMEEEAILVYWQKFRNRMLAIELFLEARERAWYRRRAKINDLNDELDFLHARELAQQQSCRERWARLSY